MNTIIINKINRSLYIIWLLEEITNNFNKYCNGLWKVSPNIQYLLELFVISSSNQIMYKLLFILFIIKLYARINIFNTIILIIILSVKKLLMLIILLWLKKLRWILKIPSLKLKIESELLSTRICLVKVYWKLSKRNISHWFCFENLSLDL